MQLLEIIFIVDETNTYDKFQKYFFELTPALKYRATLY